MIMKRPKLKVIFIATVWPKNSEERTTEYTRELYKDILCVK